MSAPVRKAPWTREEWAHCRNPVAMLRALSDHAGLPASNERKPLVLAACKCARLALPHVHTGEPRPRVAIETAEQWAEGKANVPPREVLKAAREARVAADAVARASFHAAHAAFHVAHAVHTTRAAFHAARAAFHASHSVFYALQAASAARSLEDASSAADLKSVQGKCADYVRQYFPDPPEQRRPAKHPPDQQKAS